MRGIALWVAVSLASGCAFDSGGHLGGDGPADAAVVDPPDASPPDAAPACYRDEQCAVPPNACKLAGTCDIASGTCTYPDVDCSGESDECNSGVCDPAVGCLAQPAFEDQPCGDVTACGTYGACNYSGTCDEEAVQTRDCMDYSCQAGSCVGELRVEERACARDTDGSSCGATSCGSFGACAYTGPCDEAATRSRSCVSHECAAGACEELAFTDTEPCSRPSRDGVHCAADACGAYTDCEYSPTNVCDETGIKARSPLPAPAAAIPAASSAAPSARRPTA